MKEVTLPSGLKVKVSAYDEDELIIEFNDPKIEGVVHKMRVYLYGYTDESGEHVKGYYELIEERRKKLEEEQKQKEAEWWCLW